MEINTLSDPARMAQAIRDLARDAHRHADALAIPGGPAKALPTHRTPYVRPRRPPRGPLGTWLDNLGREVRSAAVAPGRVVPR